MQSSILNMEQISHGWYLQSWVFQSVSLQLPLHPSHTQNSLKCHKYWRSICLKTFKYIVIDWFALLLTFSGPSLSMISSTCFSYIWSYDTYLSLWSQRGHNYWVQSCLESQRNVQTCHRWTRGFPHLCMLPCLDCPMMKNNIFSSNSLEESKNCFRN